MNTNPLILVVDDEEGIYQTLKEVLADEGYETIHTSDGADALSLIEDRSPDLVMLDIWLPGRDGLDILTQIRSSYTNLPVIMISGHATITTAVKATQLGAFDFLEKPLDLETTLQKVKAALDSVGQDNDSNGADRDVVLDGEPCAYTPVVYATQALPGEARPQKTLKSSSLLYGVGVHSGQKSGLILEPLPENSGIHFAGVASKHAVPAHVDYVGTTGFATTIKHADSQVATIEHLLSALHAYGITNLMVKCNKEVPVMDGSAIEFCKLIEEIGVKEQSESIYELAVDKVYQFGDGEELITIEPADSFIIDYTLSYPEPVGRQHFVYELSDPESYKQEIASARTFGFVKDIDFLQQQGLAQGGRFNNFVLIGEEGAINSELRFPDEAVRHKILDVIGDLYLLGRPLRGKVTAKMTGHSDNIELLRVIQKGFS